MNSILSLPQGTYHDRIITGEGKTIDLGWSSNIVVDQCRLLLAGFMKRERSAVGVLTLGVGRGEEGWDAAPPASPSGDTAALTDASPYTISIPLNKISYMDASGAVSTRPTNRIQISLTLAPGKPPLTAGETSFPLREFGLFGRIGRKSYMIDYVRHAVIHKKAADTLVRTIRLTF